MQQSSKRLEQAEQQYRAGLCGWEIVQQEQDAILPHCAAHNRSTSITVNGVPYCDLCASEGRMARQEVRHG